VKHRTKQASIEDQEKHVSALNDAPFRKAFMSIITKILIFILAVVCIVGGYFNYIGASRFVANSEVTYGRVVELEKKRSTDYDSPFQHIYYPIIEYSVNGISYRTRHNRGNYPPEHKIGDWFEIVYDRFNPKDGMVNLKINIWGPTFIAVFAGLLCAFVVFGRFPRSWSSKIEEARNKLQKLEQ
jgi:hypothetical protein